MNEYIFLLRQVWKGKSLMRCYLNWHLTQFTLRGKTIDIGGGTSDGRYISFMQRTNDVEFVAFDQKKGDETDFEKDPLPAPDATYDTVLFLNVMEHIYNYQHIANEVVRITKPGGQMIGYVPLLFWYHPDPLDCFRYTEDSLRIIMRNTGCTDEEIQIIPIGEGPFIAGLHFTMMIYPKVLRVVLFTCAFVKDKFLYRQLKGRNVGRYALGYIFLVNK